MATVLDKDLIRESTVKADEREIIVTLAADQRIKFKRKGMKSGEVSIGILEIYNQLSGSSSEDSVAKSQHKGGGLSITHDDEEEEEETVQKSGLLIDLNDLRSANAISGLDIQTMQKFDGIIAELIKHQKEVAASVRKVAPVKAKKKK